MRCAAILIEKRSTKSGTPLVLNAGAVFSITGPGGYSASITDDQTAAAPDENAAIGLVCVSGLQPGTYTVNETTPPSGYGAAGQSNLQAVAVAGTDCSANPPTGSGIVTFTNPPLYDLQINFRDGGSGETSINSIVCTGVDTPPDSTTPPGGWQTSVTFLNEEAPQIVICTIDVDP